VCSPSNCSSSSMTTFYYSTLFHTILLLLFLSSYHLLLYSHSSCFSSLTSISPTSFCPLHPFVPFLFPHAFIYVSCFLNSFIKNHFLYFFALTFPLIALSSPLNLSADMSLSTLNHFSSNLNEFPFILEFSIYSLCLLFLLLRPYFLYPHCTFASLNGSFPPFTIECFYIYLIISSLSSASFALLFFLVFVIRFFSSISFLSTPSPQFFCTVLSFS